MTLQEAAWPDMFANLQTAYAELTRAKFELEKRATEVHEARDLFQRVIASFGEALFVLDRNGCIIQTNPAAARLLSVGEENLVGRPFGEVSGSGEIPYTPWQLLQRSAEGTAELVAELERPGRGQVPVRVFSGLVRDKRGKITGVLVVARDVAEQRRAENTLRFLAEATRILGSSLDPDVTLASLAQLCVPTVADWCGIDLVEADGSVRRVAVAHRDPAKTELVWRIRELFPVDASTPIGHARVAACGQSILVAEVGPAERAALARTHQQATLLDELGLASHICVPILLRGRLLGSIALNRCDPERRYGPPDLELADELARRAAIALEHAELFREAQEASRMKDEFLATVSHELRTPLTAMLGWVRLVRTGALAPQQLNRALETIERNTRAQHRLVEDLLDISRIVTGTLRAELRPIDAADAVCGAIDALRPTAEQKQIRLTNELEASPAEVLADRERLQQIVWNLVANALKFTPPEGQVTVRLTRRGNSVEIHVADTGAGISREFLPHVFERFRQADGSTTRRHGGLGIGLAIARSLTEFHGGTIAVDSPGEGLGATFTVRLPALVRERAPVVVEPPRRTERIDGVRVLIVEDMKDERDLLVAILSAAGAEPLPAESAEAALQRFERDRPHVILSDIGMPEVDGYELIRRIRTIDRHHRVPAVAITAYNRAEDVSRAIAAGFQVHVAKPIEPDRLIGTISALLESRGALE